MLRLLALFGALICMTFAMPELAEAAPKAKTGAKVKAGSKAKAGKAKRGKSRARRSAPVLSAPQIALADLVQPISTRAAEEAKAALKVPPISPFDPMAARVGDALDPARALPTRQKGVALGDAGVSDLASLQALYDIPVEDQGAVRAHIRYFQTNGRRSFVRWLSRSSLYVPMMHEALREAGLPEDMVYLAMIESGFSPHAISWASAAGLWQFMEATGRMYGLKVDFWRDERRDPAKATQAAAAYLRDLYGQFGDWRLAWASYNAGPGKVIRALKAVKQDDFWGIAGGRVLKPETKNYVPKLMAVAMMAKNLELFGFSPEEIAMAKPPEVARVMVPESTELDAVARAAGVPVEQVRDLNPELVRWCTPPDDAPEALWPVRIPKASEATFAERFRALPASERLTFKVHRVAPGETISRIAAQYGTPAEGILRQNDLRGIKRVKVGSELAIPIARSDATRLALAEESRRLGYEAPAVEEAPAPASRKGGLAKAAKVKTQKVGGKTRLVYAVAAGDSLWDIARRFNVTVDAIKSWNRLSGRAPTLRVGQQLFIWPSASVS